VGWYITDGASFNGYVGLHMKENGLGLLSAPDYMALPNAFTPSIFSTFPGISYSKMSDPGLAPSVMYATYYDYTGSYTLHHAFHTWSNPVFKGAGTTATYPECSGDTHTDNLLTQKTDLVAVYPNPFNGAMNTTVTLTQDGVVNLELADVTGRSVWQHKSSLTKGTHQITSDDMEGIVPGNYMLTTSVDGKKIDTKHVVKK
jgi:hypothetical protein